MRTHTIKVRGRRASIDDRMLVQGTVGEDVLALDLDEEWDGLVVTVAFKWQHDSSIVAKQVYGGYEVPWECNQQPGKVLIAVEGTKDGKVMRHATIGHPMVVLPSEEASGTSPTDPTVSEYRKVYEDVKLATATANGAADDKSQEEPTSGVQTRHIPSCYMRFRTNRKAGGSFGCAQGVQLCTTPCTCSL